MVVGIQSGRAPTLTGRVFRGLDEAGVTWCLLRGAYRPAPDDAGDVDLLVEPGDLGRADGVFRGLGFARIPAWGRGGHRFYVAYDRTADAWLDFDVDCEISYGRYEELRTSLAGDCLRRRARAEGFWALAPDDAFWSLLMHCLFDKRDFRNDHREELTAVVDRAREDGPLATLITRFHGVEGSGRAMIDAVRSGHWNGLLERGVEIERRWRTRAGAGTMRRMLVRGVQQRATKLLNLTRRRGLSIALLGPDGAGKSTLSDAIRASFYFPVKQIYMGLYQRRSRVPSGGLGIGYRLVTQWKRSLDAAYHQSRGCLVIFDRHGHDQRLTRCGPEPLKRRVRRWLLARAAPPPDCAFVLDAPGTVLFARKGEHSAEALETQRQGFRELAELLPDVELVDVTRDPDEVRRDVLERIWLRYAARWT